MRPTARVRSSSVLRTVAKLSRQYLKWFGNASYKYEKNGERWLLETLRKEPIRTVVDVGANVGKWSLIAAEMFPQATIYALEIIPATAAELRARTAGQSRIKPFSAWQTTLARSPCATTRRRAPTQRSLNIRTAGRESGSGVR